MSQGIGWLIVVSIWCLPFLIGLIVICVLFYKNSRKTKSAAQSLWRTFLLLLLILIGFPLVHYLYGVLFYKIFSVF